jgi:hypothetical protein
MVTYFLGVDIGVIMPSRNVGVKNKSIHFSIPGLRRLLKAIKIFLKEINKVGFILNIDKRLFHVNLLL